MGRRWQATCCGILRSAVPHPAKIRRFELPGRGTTRGSCGRKGLEAGLAGVNDAQEEHPRDFLRRLQRERAKPRGHRGASGGQVAGGESGATPVHLRPHRRESCVGCLVLRGFPNLAASSKSRSSCRLTGIIPCQYASRFLLLLRATESCRSRAC